MIEFPLPAGLSRLLAAGAWPSADGPSMIEQQLHPIIASDRVRSFAADETLICLQPPPFPTIAKERAAGGAVTSGSVSVPSNRSTRSGRCSSATSVSDPTRLSSSITSGALPGRQCFVCAGVRAVKATNGSREHAISTSSRKCLASLKALHNQRAELWPSKVPTFFDCVESSWPGLSPRPPALLMGPKKSHFARGPIPCLHPACEKRGARASSAVDLWQTAWLTGILKVA